MTRYEKKGDTLYFYIGKDKEETAVYEKKSGLVTFWKSLTIWEMNEVTSAINKAVYENRVKK